MYIIIQYELYFQIYLDIPSIILLFVLKSVERTNQWWWITCICMSIVYYSPSLTYGGAGILFRQRARPVKKGSCTHLPNKPKESYDWRILGSTRLRYFFVEGEPCHPEGQGLYICLITYHIYCTLIAWSHVTTSDPLTWSDFPFNQVFGGGRAISKKQAKSR